MLGEITSYEARKTTESCRLKCMAWYSRGEVATLPGNYMRFYDNVYAVLRLDMAVAISTEEAGLTILVIDAAIASHAGCRPITLTV